MARVFVSHAGQDRDLAGEVFGWLVDDGHELFFDRDLRAGLAVGEQWEQRLFERLRWADAVVCLVTSAYVGSVWCTAELTTAMNRGSRVLPLIAEAEVRHPLLTGIQHTDHTGDPAAARAALGEALRRLDAVGGRGWVDGRSPFPGLRAFDTDMHRVFFGRRAEVSKLTELLRSPVERADRGVLVVTGPSGCGKSSLVRAGVLPVMADEPGWWTLPAVPPGADPVGALSREITGEARNLGLAWELPRVRSRLAREGPVGVIEELLLATPGRGGRRRLLIVIDQFEELLTLAGDADRARFAGVLRAAVAGPAQVLVTLRPEFLAPLLASPELTGVTIRTFTLRPLPLEALAEVIRGPADLAGIGVDAELVTRLVTDTGTGQALPLLAFTLQQLAGEIDRGGQLSLTRYEQLGGVRGALTSQADAALAAATTATGRTPQQVIGGLLRLVTVDEQGRPTRSRIPVDDLPAAARTELAAFTTRRLLTTDTENGTAVAGVAHEAFLSTWPPLTQAITDAAAALRTRRVVEQAATEWDTNGRHRDRLWERGQLAAALSDLDDPTQSGNRSQNAEPRPTHSAHPPSPRRRLRNRRRLSGTKVDLGPRARDFLLASIRIDRRRRTRATTILSLLLIAARAAVGIVYAAQRNAQEQQRVSLAGQLAATSVSRVATNLDVANLLAVQAYRTDPNPQTRSALFNAVTASGALVRYLPFGGHVSELEGSGDGRVVVTGLRDGRVLRWALDAPAPELLATLPGEVTGLAVNSGGAVVAAVGGGEAVVARTGGEPRRFETTGGQAPDLVAVTPSGRTVVVHGAQENGRFGASSIAVYDVPTGTVRQENLTPDPDMGPSIMVATSEDEVLLLDRAYGGWDRRRISDWSLIDGSTANFGVHNYAVGVSSSGRWFTYTNAGSTISIWTTSGPTDSEHPPLTAQAPLTVPLSLTLSPDGSRAAVADTGVIYVAPVAPAGVARETAVQLNGTGNPNIDGVRFLGDSDHLISAVGDTVAVWNMDQTDRITRRIDAPIERGCNACFPVVAVSPDGAHAAVEAGLFGQSFVVSLGDPTDGRSLTYIPGTQTPVWTSDGSQVVLPSESSPNAKEPETALPAIARTVPVPEGADSVVAASKAANGRGVIVVDQRGRVFLIDIETGGLLTTVAAPPPAGGRYDAAVSSTADLAALLDSMTPGQPVTIIDAHTGATVGTVTGDDLGAVAFAGHRLLVQHKNGTLEVWDERATAIERVIAGDSSYYLPPVGGEQGSLVARQRGDSTIDLVDLDSGSVIGTFPPSTRLGRKTAIAFNADGTKLITATEGTLSENEQNGFLEIRDVSDQTLIRMACATAGRDLTPQEWQTFVGAEIPDNLACH